jgi:hypothetical protein
MQHQANSVRSEHDRRIERAVVLQVLRDDHQRLWPVGELKVGLAPIAAPVVASAVDRLEQADVVRVQFASVWASSAARRLDELGLIAV